MGYFVRGLGLFVGAVGLAFLLPSCGSEAAFQEPPVPSFAVLEPAPGVAGTIALGQEVSRRVGRLRAACLEQNGHPEMLRATQLASPGNVDLVHAPLTVLPLEYGPNTKAEALKYGLAGVELAADQPSVGGVAVNDVDFERATERCDRWLYRSRAPGLRSLQSEAAAFQDAVGSVFIAGIGRRIQRALRDRAVCVARHGYPAFTPRRFVRAPSMAALVEGMGIPLGSVVGGSAEVPQAAALPRGTVRIYPPAGLRSYRPSRAEVALAETFADCGRAVRFTERAASAEHEARRDVVRSFRDRAVRLTERLHGALLLLGRRRPS